MVLLLLAVTVTVAVLVLLVLRVLLVGLVLCSSYCILHLILTYFLYFSSSIFSSSPSSFFARSLCGASNVLLT